jgi:hypothetical protein
MYPYNLKLLLGVSKKTEKTLKKNNKKNRTIKKNLLKF